jgi:hypothetical protein
MACKHPKPCALCKAQRKRHETALRKAGKCFRHPAVNAVSGDTCQVCVEAAKARRALSLANGKCTIHKLRDAVAGRTNCAECLLIKRLTYLRLAGLSEVEIQKAREAAAIFNGVCQCCGGLRSHMIGKGFAFDHNHLTKQFRGIICAACNLAIGHSQENIERLQRIIHYLTGR